jgi:3-hydroxybutyryl-CoA dehydrogenase
MKILVIGDAQNNSECQQKFGAHHSWYFAPSHAASTGLLADAEVIFDFNPDKETLLNYQSGQPNLFVFLNTTLTTLAELLADEKRVDWRFFGFCGLPTFLNRELLEASIAHADDLPSLETICMKLNTTFECVADQVGLVTPRIICMIINEAYFTLEEGIATQSDIDLAMKLGTNYPYGPFEWAKRIGLSNVYKVLKAMHKSTQDERYLISPLLTKEAEL